MMKIQSIIKSNQSNTNNRQRVQTNLKNIKSDSWKQLVTTYVNIVLRDSINAIKRFLRVDDLRGSKSGVSRNFIDDSSPLENSRNKIEVNEVDCKQLRGNFDSRI